MTSFGGSTAWMTNKTDIELIESKRKMARQRKKILMELQQKKQENWRLKFQMENMKTSWDCRMALRNVAADLSRRRGQRF